MHPLAELPYQVFYNVRGCRNGEFLDFGALFKFMELSEIASDTQLEIFYMIRAVESDWHRREFEKIEKNKKKDA